MNGAPDLDVRQVDAPIDSLARQRGFHWVSKPELIESIIVDIGTLATSHASLHSKGALQGVPTITPSHAYCSFVAVFNTPRSLINLSRFQEMLSVFQLVHEPCAL